MTQFDDNGFLCELDEFDDNGFFCELDEFEHLLDNAMLELEESNISQSHIDIIRQACGKSKKPRIEPEMLDQLTNDFDQIFGKGKSAPL